MKLLSQRDLPSTQ